MQRGFWTFGIRTFATGLQGRLILLALVPALIAVMLASAAGIVSSRGMRDGTLAEALAGAVLRADWALRDAEARMHATAAALAGRPDLAASLAEGPPDALRSVMAEAFRTQRGIDSRLAVLEATDAAGRVLFRAHNPGAAGDDKSQVADVRLALGGSPALGVVVSPSSGELAIGAVLPVERQGRLVGTVKAAARLNDATARQVASLTGGEAILFGAGRLAASTLPDLDAGALLAALRDAPGPVRIELAGQGAYLARGMPIRDVTGQASGLLVLAMPLAGWQAAERASLFWIGGAGLLVLLGALPAALLAASRLARSLAGMAAAMRRLAAGETGIAIPGHGRRDELGAMAAALEQFRDSLEAKARLEAAAAVERGARERRAAAMERHTAAFGRSVAGVMAALGQSAAGMQAAAQGMAESARQTEGRATATAGEADTAAANLSTVASAAEELTASVAEISRQVAQAAQVARDAVAAAKATDARMQALSGGAERITGVVRLIGEIAGQTNLLALNATIEAARAGEMGKGFAVVAGEVKQLAAQTAKATGEVAAQISGMREATAEATTAMQAVTDAIGRMDEVAAAIAAAVEEQGAATREINLRVQAVSATTTVVAGAMQDLSEVARQSGTASGQVLEAAQAVGAQATTLNAEVDGFIEVLRSDDGERRRTPRQAVPGQRKALLRLPDGREVEAILRDVSAGGMGLACASPPPAGTALHVVLPGAGAPVAASIAWAAEGRLGLAFAEPARAAREVEALLRRPGQAA
ncbi:methyl-accepting chemotaxis protein [Paracraurococcus lichenis]|uniref:Methyl-accepting chemotaxis protein n=1 Tax=Paracraurococcus lichenis TaxID=3064888 RepID=A0ABT9E0T9_9PROT|nr:methyl-accepting chemotaxis protein [Paracraurococcus sp. LOR1-02]MDO9709768.1 methyl-accepting chemotaxis protein [Paracraurococcus sp. LOR1-02]